jgi:2-oxoglutarate dehydrogenase E2 component (dihydrolipoamide succinyltransferase)
MPVEIRVPALGESVVDATISKWLKQEGETVTAGEAVVELETDKVNIEVPVEQDGTLTQIVKQEGDTVGIGEVLAIVDGGAPATAAAPASAPPVEAAPASTAEPAPAAPTAEASGGNGNADMPINPVARRVANEHAVDIRQVTGSGPGGRITKDDVVRHIGTQPAEGTSPVESAAMPAAPTARPAPPTPAARTAAAARPAPPAPVVQTQDREERVRMSRRRQTIARRLVEAQQTAAMLTTFNEIDMTAVMEVRKRRRDAFKERHGVNLGFMSFFTKAVVGALKAFPLLNAEIQGDEIVIKHHYDIGIAVGAEEGLVVPVLRDADRKSFAQIEREIGELAGRARNSTLTIPELQGGTFTITNGGIFGSLMSTPILNTPQVGILGMHKIQERPVALDGQIVIRPMMYVALSYDHRIVDGSEAVRFLVRIKELVEDPETLLLEG